MVINMNNKRLLIRVFIFSLLCFIIDFTSKLLIKYNLSLLDTITVVKNFFYITYTKNVGGAWSILEEKQLFLIFISIIFLFFLISYIVREEHINNFSLTYYSLIIGGVFGNLVDRIFRGYVIDFLSFNIFGYYFPIFNFADIFIVIGFLLLIVDEVRRSLCKNY